MKRTLSFAAVLIAVAALAGCATPKSWTALSGSRADATVTLGYEYGLFEQPQLDNSGQALALQRCRAWGYTGAEAFGAEMSQCVSWSSSGCRRTQVTKTFQCLGDGTPGGHAYIDMTVRG